jgi:Domain of unknown function (DUF397)
MTAFDLSRAVWRKSARSGQNGNCVEVANAGPAVAVRNSKDSAGPKLVVEPRNWRRFAADVKDGSLDLACRLGFSPLAATVSWDVPLCRWIPAPGAGAGQLCP